MRTINKPRTMLQSGASWWILGLGFLPGVSVAAFDGCLSGKPVQPW